MFLHGGIGEPLDLGSMLGHGGGVHPGGAPAGLRLDLGGGSRAGQARELSRLPIDGTRIHHILQEQVDIGPGAAGAPHATTAQWD